MMEDLESSMCLPFRIPSVYGGFAEARGILKAGKESLSLDFETKESLLDLLRLETKVVSIPLAEVASVELRKGWFSRWVIIAVNRLEALRQVPGSQAGEIRLKISRKNGATAAELVSRIQMALTTRGLKSLINEMEDASRPSSVSNAP